MKNVINNEKSNYFMGSCFKNRYQSKDSVIRCLRAGDDKDQKVVWIGFQLEGSEDIAHHWQYVFKTKGKQHRQSYYRRMFKWYHNQEMKDAGWITACNSEKACKIYSSKEETKLGEFIEWDISKGYEYKRYVFDGRDSERKRTLGLLENKMNEIEQWSDWMRFWKEENPGVKSLWANTRDMIGGGCGLKNK